MLAASSAAMLALVGGIGLTIPSSAISCSTHSYFAHPRTAHPWAARAWAARPRASGMIAALDETEAALLSRDDAKLLELTPDMLRVREIDDLEELIEELEAAAANYLDASGGQPSLTLSRLLATAHSRVGDPELGVSHARAALAAGCSEPEQAAEMHFVLGLAAERRDDEDVALGHYEDAIVLDAKCWRALFHVGKIAISFGAVDMGIEYLRKVQAINPDHAPTDAFLTSLDALQSDDDDDNADETATDTTDDADDTTAATIGDLPLPEGLESFDMDPDGL